MLKNDTKCCIITNTKTKSPAAIRISLTPEVRRALKLAKTKFPALSNSEILKLGLSNIIADNKEKEVEKERSEIMAIAAHSVGYDYLSDPEEDIYHEGMGKKVNFE